MSITCREIRISERSNVLQLLFQRPASEKVHLAPKDFLKFLLYLNMVKETPVIVRSKGNQDIDVALGSEILPER
jgi:hypothetical protein